MTLKAKIKPSIKATNLQAQTAPRRAPAPVDEPGVAVPTVRMSNETRYDPSPLDYNLAYLEEAVNAARSRLQELGERLSPVCVYAPGAESLAEPIAGSPVQVRVQEVTTQLRQLTEHICYITDSLVV